MSPIDQPPAGQPPTGQPPPPSRDNADASIPPAPPRIADRYTVLSLLGVGGMGSVYRVRDDSLDEVVRLPGGLNHIR